MDLTGFAKKACLFRAFITDLECGSTMYVFFRKQIRSRVTSGFSDQFPLKVRTLAVKISTVNNVVATLAFLLVEL